MAGTGREKIEKDRAERAMKRTIGQMNREGRAKVDRALAEMLAQYAKDHPVDYERARGAAGAQMIGRVEAAKAAATNEGRTYTPLTEQEYDAQVDVIVADRLGIAPINVFEAQVRPEPEPEEEGAGPLEPIRIQIEQLPSAPALQPPPQLVEPITTKIPQLNDQVQNLPTPGSLQYLVLALLFFLAAIVPMLVWNGKGYTRLQLLWRSLFGGATLPESDYHKAIDAKQAAIQAGRTPLDAAMQEQIGADVYNLWTIGTAAVSGVFGGGSGPDDATGGYDYGFGAAGDMLPSVGPDYGSSAAAMQTAGDPFAYPVGNPGGGWLYDNNGMLQLQQPAGQQNGARLGRRKRRGG